MTHRPTVSVAIAALNEGAQVQATVSCLLASKTVPDEIVVYDDCSVDPCPDVRGARYVQGTRKLGSGGAKQAAVNECEGDVIVVLDAHCRPAVDWLCHILDAHRRAPWAVLCPVCVGIDSASYRSGSFRGMGGELKMGPRGFWEVQWHPPQTGVHAYCVPAVIGGCYVIPRNVLDLIGGYAPGLKAYGNEEEYLALRTWLVGCECKVVPTSVVGHYFDRPLNRESTDKTKENEWAQDVNRHIMARVCFGLS